MGLIGAAIGAVGGALADTWKDWFYCESLDKETLMVKGEKMVGNRSSNKKGNDNIISNGSGIVVADGQCMIIVDQGKVVEICAEPGEFTYDASSEPSLFSGKLGSSIIETFKTMGKRIGYGGSEAHDQRVYYFNTKEIIDNKFGTPNPVPYKDWGHALLNARTGGYTPMRLDIKCFGTYTFKISNPAVFMANIAGTADVYKKDTLVEQMRSEVVGAFSNVLNSLSEDEYKIEALSLPNKTDEIKDIMATGNFDGAIENRGISLVSFAVESVTLTEESNKKIDQYELAGDQFQQQGVLTDAYANAVQDAAKNANGSMTGFMGIGMMGGATGNPFGAVTQNIANSVNYATPNAEQFKADTAVKAEVQKETPKADEWVCSCGTVNTGKFCTECGKAEEEKKVCPKCGEKVEAGMKFCPHCGEKLD